MSTMTVWKFPTATAAHEVESTLKSLQSQQLITILDAALVAWPEGAKKPKTRQLRSLAGAGALGGAFWGLLFGLIFFVPLLGAAIGAAMGAISGSLMDVGIDDKFIEQTRQQITPGTSALFLLSENAVVDKVSEAFKGSFTGELIQSNLSGEQEAKLREVFAEPAETPAARA